MCMHSIDLINQKKQNKKTYLTFFGCSGVNQMNLPVVTVLSLLFQVR